MIDELIIRPPRSKWSELIAHQPRGSFANRSLGEWRKLTREELGIESNGLVAATGHQTLLWHPGILAKYMALEVFARETGCGRANLIVDQHADGFGDLDIPIRRHDGSLGVRTLELCRPSPRKGVPMGRHEAFTPPQPPDALAAALPCVDVGVRQIIEAVYSHRHAENAAMQMAHALVDLMQSGGWVQPMPIVSSTHLLHTSLAREMMRKMAEDPWKCAECYNHAVTRVTEARIGTLLIRDDYVELPLWRIRDDGRRMHAYDNDVQAFIDRSESGLNSSHSRSPIDLMPRALFMTALVRLGMCDLFIHGSGGARYDAAMELWIREWLGLSVAPIAVATATVRLPLSCAEGKALPLEQAHRVARAMWHDPAPGTNWKAPWLAKINTEPRNSMERRASYQQFQDELASRRTNNPQVKSAREQLERSKRAQADQEVACRRDWAFPLYPENLLNELQQAIGQQRE